MAPSVELYTMGAGDDLFSAFGHAAICVRDAIHPNGHCYNYGTTDFQTPIPLTWDFIRGRALFWVATRDLPSMLHYYQESDRTIYRQRLPLAPGQVGQLVSALEASTDEHVKYYRYHHFNDNCTTRIRDLLDASTGGALRRDSSATGPTYRQYVRQGFAGSWPLLVVVESVIGRPADRPTDRWTAMFLPSEFRVEVERRLGARPEILYLRRAPIPGGSESLGVIAFVVLGLCLGVMLLGAARLGPRAGRAALLVTGLSLGLIGTILWALAMLSTFRELRINESLLAFWPSDFLLGFLATPRLARYLQLRLIVVLLIVAAHAVGLVQPLGPLVAVALPMICALVCARINRAESGVNPPAQP